MEASPLRPRLRAACASVQRRAPAWGSGPTATQRPGSCSQPPEPCCLRHHDRSGMTGTCPETSSGRPQGGLLRWAPVHPDTTGSMHAALMRRWANQCMRSRPEPWPGSNTPATRGRRASPSGFGAAGVASLNPMISALSVDNSTLPSRCRRRSSPRQISGEFHGNSSNATGNADLMHT